MLSPSSSSTRLSGEYPDSWPFSLSRPSALGDEAEGGLHPARPHAELLP